MNDTTHRAAAGASAPAQRLQRTMAAARVSFTWLGVRKTLSREQKEQAAESFGAEGQYLSAAKKLLDTAHPAFKAVTAIRNRAIAYWRAVSLPYPEPGIRLIRQDHIESFDRHMTDMRQELAEAVQQLSERYAELKEAARDRLGTLYDPTDYPADLGDMFELGWDFPSVEAPQYLLELKPEIYEQEKSRIAARFEEAVKLAEDAFAADFGKLVAHLRERLSGSDDGKPRVFRDSCVENLKEFFGRFRSLSVRSSPQLDDLVEQARQLVAGIAPQDLRDSEGLRQQIHGQLSAMQSAIDSLLVEHLAGGSFGAVPRRRHDGVDNRSGRCRSLRLWRGNRPAHAGVDGNSPRQSCRT